MPYKFRHQEKHQFVNDEWTQVSSEGAGRNSDLNQLHSWLPRGPTLGFHYDWRSHDNKGKPSSWKSPIYQSINREMQYFTHSVLPATVLYIRRQDL